jgi:hypothetical protein
VADLAASRGVQLLDDMHGHAGIATFIDQGYEVLVF